MFMDEIGRNKNIRIYFNNNLNSINNRKCRHTLFSLKGTKFYQLVKYNIK